MFPGMIGVTQPRRVAAVSMAERVADELNLHDGQVTYQIRYDKAQLGANTRIKFMTDGILLRELSSVVQAKGKGDLLLSQYSCIIIDEAHERTVGTDILIGWLTRIVRLRNSGKIKGIGPLKLVIMSATLRVEDFTNNATLFPTDLGETVPPVVKVDGRQHKVVIHYNKRTPELDYISEAYKKVVKIHTKLPHGGVLVFVTGQQEVQILCRKLKKMFPMPNATASQPDETAAGGKDQDLFGADIDDAGPDFTTDAPDDYEELLKQEEEESDEEEETHILSGTVADEEDEEEDAIPMAEDGRRVPLHVLPLYSMLSTADQLEIFKPPPEGTRLVVVATNVAETSLTIPGIKYVVDCGKVKEASACYDTQTGIQNFKVGWTSTASSNQRAGRAGRLGPGHCYRLFSSAVFESYFEPFSKPEILRVPIPGVVLSMKSMGINQVVGFPFPTPPDRHQLKDAETLLKHLGSLQDDLKISPTGKLMANFPIAPRYAKMIVVAAQQAQDVLMYTIAVAAGLSVGELFYRDMELLSDKKPPASDDEAESMDEDEAEARKEKRSQYFKTMAMFAGKAPVSDILMMLRAVGAYLGQMALGPAELEEFCTAHFLRSKAMDEVVKLIQQLTNIAKSTFDIPLEFGFRLAPPDRTQETLLRQVILSGYVDCVAKLDETRMAGYGKHAIPAYQTIWSNQNEQFIIHNSSCLFRDRPAPKWIVYDQVQARREMFGPDAQKLELRQSSDGIERKFLKGITVIQDTWLVKQGSTLTNFGRFLDQPEPRYSATADVVQGYVAPTFGPKLWELPLSERVLTDGKEATGWFAKALLEGQIDLPPGTDHSVFGLLLPYLSTKPSVLTKSWAMNQARVSQVLQTLLANKVSVANSSQETHS
ncbi:ATP-dependent RNA helicase dhx37 [Kappamyces sp. JEL0680]|nr:ATP-dependent RNA helicase dhx37 [Kappamyces sp. JEL0680]